MDWIIDTWNQFYFWAGSQPVFIQIVIGIALLYVLYLAVVISFGLILSWLSN